jgi:hypothetical protein
MSNSEVRVMDAFLINIYNHWQQQWVLEQEGFLKSGESQAVLMTDVPFYLGSTFAQVWWEDLKSTHYRIQTRRLIGGTWSVFGNVSESGFPAARSNVTTATGR